MGFSSIGPRKLPVFAIPEIPIPGTESGMESVPNLLPGGFAPVPSSPRRRGGHITVPDVRWRRGSDGFPLIWPPDSAPPRCVHCPVLTQCPQASTRAIRASG